MYALIIKQVSLDFPSDMEGNEVATAGHQSAGLQQAEGTVYQQN
jgi:hypothetical protein